MKKTTFRLFIGFVLAIILCAHSATAQNIGINTDGSTPDNSAMLDISSAKSGLLIPRVELSSLTDATTIENPANSLLVYNNGSSIAKGYYYNEGTPSSPNWVPFLYKGNAWNVTGNAGTTAGTNFLGTTDAQDMIIKTNGTERIKINKAGGAGAETPTMLITSAVDTASGLKIDVNSFTKGNALKLTSTSTAGLSGASGATRMIYIRQAGINAVAGHRSVGTWAEISNSGSGSINYGSFHMLSGAYQQEGVHTEITGVADATLQTIYGNYVSINANNNSNALSTQYGMWIRSRGTCATNIGVQALIESGSASTYGFKAVNTALGSLPQYGIYAGVGGTMAAGTSDINFAGYFTNNTISTLATGWAYGIRTESTGSTAVGINCAAFITAANAPSGKNYAIIVPHYNAASNWGGWVGIGCLDPQRLLQVDGTVRVGGLHEVGRIELQNAYNDITTIQSGSTSGTNLNFVLPGTKGAVNDVLMVSSIAGDSTTLVWAPSPTLDYWSLAGNSGTTPGTDYIGTNDLTDFVVKTNGVERWRFKGNGTIAETSGSLVVGTVMGVGCAWPAGAFEAQGGNIVLNTTTNSNTYINSTSSTGTVSIGNSSSGIISIASGNAVNISTGNGINATTTLGTSGAQVFASSTAGSDKIYLVPQSSTTTGAFNGTLTSNDLTANRQWTLPDAGGNFLLTAGPGTTTTVLHGNATGLPTWGAVNLTSDVSGTLPVGNGGTGTATSPTQGGVIYATSTSAYASTAAGTSGDVLQSNGSSAPTWTTNHEFIGMRTFTSGTTSYTPTSGTTKIVVEMWGGGGAGGGVNATAGGAGGGGGSGGYARYYWNSVGAGPYTIAIGAGGTGASGAVGGNGGNTTFNNGTTTITAYGGAGGAFLGGSGAIKFTLGGAGGAVSTNGTVNGAGAPGGNGMTSTATTVTNSGFGGSTSLGGGGLGRTGTGAGNAAVANTGSGGSGASNIATTANAGGNGAAGLMIIYEYK